MRNYIIGKNDAGQRLDKFITKTLPSLPKSLMYKYLRLKRIKLNGKKADISARLNEGDSVDMYISDEFFAEKEEKYSFLGAGKALDIIYEDENIMVLDKKAGLLSHPDEGEYVDTLIGRVQRYLYEKGEYDPKNEASFTPALANRIDRNTGGIVLAAKNAESLRILNEKIKYREIKKLYLCLLIGCPPKKSDTLCGYITKDEKKEQGYGFVRTCSRSERNKDKIHRACDKKRHNSYSNRPSDRQNAPNQSAYGINRLSSFR